LKKLLALALSLFLTSAARAAVALDATTAFQDSLSNASLSYSHTCAANASVLLVKVVLFSTGADTITSATYDGVSMTRGEFNNGSATQDLMGYVFYLNSPHSGTHTVLVTASGIADFVSSSESWTGTDTSHAWVDFATVQCGTPASGATTCTVDLGAVYPISYLVGVNTFFTGSGSATVSSGAGNVTEFSSLTNADGTTFGLTGEKTSTQATSNISYDLNDAGILSAISMNVPTPPPAPSTPSAFQGVTVKGIRTK